MFQRPYDTDLTVVRAWGTVAEYNVFEADNFPPDIILWDCQQEGIYSLSFFPTFEQSIWMRGGRTTNTKAHHDIAKPSFILKEEYYRDLQG